MSLNALIDERIRAFLEERKAAVPEAASLIDEIDRVLSAGGKRIRPAFCYWGYRAAGGPDRVGPFVLQHLIADTASGQMK
mgnify:CR=1 FL=1